MLNKLKNIRLEILVFFIIIVGILHVIYLLVLALQEKEEIKSNYATIKNGQGEYYTREYIEKDGCVVFDNKKICGNYTIINKKGK